MLFGCLIAIIILIVFGWLFIIMVLVGGTAAEKAEKKKLSEEKKYREKTISELEKELKEHSYRFHSGDYKTTLEKLEMQNKIDMLKKILVDKKIVKEMEEEGTITKNNWKKLSNENIFFIILVIIVNIA